MEERRKYLLFGLLIAVLLIPLFQKLTQLGPEHALDGKQPKTPPPQWSWANWTSGSYQEQANWYYTQEAGFRNTMVRTNNQLYYSLYGVAKANAVALGQGGYIFSAEEVHEFVTPFVDSVCMAKSTMDSLRFVQDRLEADGKHFLMVLVPNKVIVYPEFSPIDSGPPTTRPLYVSMVSAAKEKGVNLLDLTDWYTQLRHRIPYPVYTRGGMHWSVIGQCHTLDTLLQALSAETGTALPSARIDTVSWSPVPLYEDNDLALGLNLLQIPTLDSTAYAKVSFTGPPAQRVLVAADSYYDHIFHNFSSQMFQRSSYWFYLEDLHGKDRGMIPDSLVKVQDEIAGHDVVVLLVSTNSLIKMPRKFLREFYTWYASPAYHDLKISQFISSMKADAGWQQNLRAKALAQGLPLDTVMLRDAEYLWKIGAR